MVCKYLKVALVQEPSYNLYGKLSGMSKEFKEIINNANKEATPVAANSTI